MNDYSDILFLITAMILLSLITTNMVRTYATTNDQLVRSELEYRVMAAAQDEIDRIRWVDNAAALDSAFVRYPITRTVLFGSNDQYSDQVSIAAFVEQVVDPTPNMERYRVTVTASSTYLTPVVTATLNYIKSFRL